jgi:hypothetical protein
MARFDPQDERFEARVRMSFARQTAMATLGIEIADVKAGEVELRMPYSAAYAQQHGLIHAGIITTALDTASGYAAFSLMPDDAAVLTSSSKPISSSTYSAMRARIASAPIANAAWRHARCVWRRPRSPLAGVSRLRKWNAKPAP